MPDGNALLQKAGRALGDPHRTLREATVLSDYLRFRARSSGALRGARPRRTGVGTALLISMSDFVYQLKLEGVLAKALQLEGYRPVVVTLPRSRWAEPYFRAFGIEDFVHPGDLVSTDRAAEAEDAVVDYLRGEISVQSLKGLEFHGAQVGLQTLSTLSRRFQQGRLSPSAPELRPHLEEVLRESLRSVVVGEELIDRVRPDVALFNEKGYAGLGSIYDTALNRGANVVQFLSGGMHWADALMFKRYTAETRRAHASSLSSESWERVRAMDWGEERERLLDAEFALRYGDSVKHPDAGLQEGKRLKSVDAVRQQLGLDPKKKTVVVFSHVLWDANLFYGEDLFEDQETWLVETVREACANPRVNWIVKLHPANMYKAATGELNDEAAIREAVGTLPAHVRLLRPETDINTYSLFALADAGVTIRGTIGMELPCFGIPALTAGTGRYSNLGFTVDSATEEEYRCRLRAIDELERLSPSQVELARRHAYAVFRLRPFRFTSFRSSFAPVSKLSHPLSYNLNVTLRTAAAVEAAEDLRSFAAWALDRSHLDYLNEAELRSLAS